MTVDEQVMVLLRELDKEAQEAGFPPLNYASIKSFLFKEVKKKLTEVLSKNDQDRPLQERKV